MSKVNSFGETLSVPVEDIVFQLRGVESVPWADFLLNPRRLRGSDFLMRWSQGRWSEERLLEALNSTSGYYAIAYGPSSVAPRDDVRDFELYFERLDAAGLGEVKRPDLMVFRQTDASAVRKLVEGIGGESELPFTPEADLQKLLSFAIMGIECENSLWKATEMRNYGEELRPQRRLAGKRGLPKSTVVPTVIIKEEDREPLNTWEEASGIGIHIWHVFYECAYGLSLSEAERLIEEGLISPTEQTFQAPGGPTSRKRIWKIYYHYAYRVGDAADEPDLSANVLLDASGHILPYVAFSGGSLELHQQALDKLAEAAERRSE